MWARIPRQRSDWESVNGVSPSAVVWESDPECANLSSECESCVAFENNLSVEGGNKNTKRRQREKRARQEHREMVEAGEATEIPEAAWLSPIGPLTERKTRRQAAMWALCDMLDEVLTEKEECNQHCRNESPHSDASVSGCVDAGHLKDH